MSDRTTPPYLTTLAQFAANTPLNAISAAARERARWIIADCIPVIAAGMQQPEMQKYVACHLAGAAPGEAGYRETFLREFSRQLAALPRTSEIVTMLRGQRDKIAGLNETDLLKEITGVIAPAIARRGFCGLQHRFFRSPIIEQKFGRVF